MNFEQITMSDDEGRFPFRTLNPGAYQITAEAPNFRPVTRDIPVSSRLTVENIHFRSVSSVQKISVVEPTSDALTPDPGERTFLHSNCSKRILAGQEPQSQFPACRSKRHPAESKLHVILRPGSQEIMESPSRSTSRSGIYFSRIIFRRNAHSNGYADPNILIP